MTIVGLDLLNGVSKEIRLDKERQGIVSQISYWKNIVSKQSSYRDGYIELAILEYQLNDKVKSRMYLQSALSIDPNFEKSRELESLLK
jgi:hypothetical protein